MFVKRGIFALKFASNCILRKKISTLRANFSREVFKIEKMRKHMKKAYCCKKRFHPFKRHLEQKWRAVIMLMVADRFVTTENSTVFTSRTKKCKTKKENT